MTKASPRVRVRVSLGGTKPKLRAMALDMRGAVLPEDPGMNSSPKSPEAMLGRLLAPVGEVRLPADAKSSCQQSKRSCLEGLWSVRGAIRD